jgi:polyphosphate glucokinase
VNVLVIDVGGTHVKLAAAGQGESHHFASGAGLTPDELVRTVREQAAGWDYDAVSLGYPGLVSKGGPKEEPENLGRGWVGFDFAAAFGRPVKVLNDAAMQALGSYEGGRMLFLGLGTAVGSTLIVQKVVIPLELGQLPFRDRALVDYLGREALQRDGRPAWEGAVAEAVGRPEGGVRGGLRRAGRRERERDRHNAGGRPAGRQREGVRGRGPAVGDGSPTHRQGGRPVRGLAGGLLTAGRRRVTGCTGRPVLVVTGRRCGRFSRGRRACVHRPSVGPPPATWLVAVADAAHGHDPRPPLPQPAAQFLDVHVHRALRRRAAEAALHQLGAAEGSPRPPQQHRQEAELGRGEGEFLPAGQHRRPRGNEGEVRGLAWALS